MGIAMYNVAMQMTIGEQITLHRRRLGLSQTEMAKKAKLSRRAVVMLENGHGNPHMDTIRAIAKVFKLSLRITFE